MRGAERHALFPEQATWAGRLYGRRTDAADEHVQVGYYGIKKVFVSKAAVILLCACSAIAWQNPPKLRRVGASDAAVAGNLEGFRPLHKVWPDVATNWTDGRRISISVLVAKGKPYEFRVTGDPDHIAEPFLDALKQWSFAMPADGTSPVRFTVTWEARDGRFVVQETDIGLK